MPKFIKKRIVIEAIQWDGSKYCFEQIKKLNESVKVSWNHGRLEIETLEGVMEASMLDWVIKGVKGELYPCKPDIFEASYELYFEDKNIKP